MIIRYTEILSKVTTVFVEAQKDLSVTQEDFDQVAANLLEEFQSKEGAAQELLNCAIRVKLHPLLISLLNKVEKIDNPKEFVKYFIETMPCYLTSDKENFKKEASKLNALVPNFPELAFKALEDTEYLKSSSEAYNNKVAIITDNFIPFEVIRKQVDELNSKSLPYEIVQNILKELYPSNYEDASSTCIEFSDLSTVGDVDDVENI